MSHRTPYVSQFGPPAFPRFAIYDASGLTWNGTAWGDRPLLYADWTTVSNDCFDLQLREAEQFSHNLIVEVPLRLQAFGNSVFQLDQLRDWLARRVSVTVDITFGAGPTQDSLVLGSIEWPRAIRTE